MNLFITLTLPYPHRNINNEGEYERVKVTGERVDAVVAEDVALLKMDVEGFEPTAFESAKGVLDTFRRARAGGTRAGAQVSGVLSLAQSIRVGRRERCARASWTGSGARCAWIQPALDPLLRRACQPPFCHSFCWTCLRPGARHTQRSSASLPHCVAATLTTRYRHCSPGRGSKRRPCRAGRALSGPGSIMHQPHRAHTAHRRMACAADDGNRLCEVRGMKASR